jgi:hypothetical protein
LTCWGHKKARRKKTGPKAGLFRAKLITSKQQEQQQQQPKRLPKQPKRQPKRQQQRPKQPKQQRQQQQERQEQQRQRPEQLGSRRLVQRLELLLSCCKQPEQQPAGKRSAGIFSWIFLN